jgi:chorismate synthase
MSGLRWTTAGESHGSALVGILEGFPSGFALDLALIQGELARRQGGHGRGGRMKIEEDACEVLSGLRAGLTLGSPLALVVRNKDATIERLPVPTNARPGHADLAGCLQHEMRDPRLVLERASARETAMRTALGSVARQLLEHCGARIFAHVVELGGERAAHAAIEAAFADPEAARRALRSASPVYSLDPAFDARAVAAIDAAKAAGDTLGGVYEVRVHGLLPGLGGYMQGEQRLTARLAAACLSIPAMKGIEFGDGFELARRPGSMAHDAIEARPAGDGPMGTRYGRSTNRSGGLEGGMTTGEPLVLRVAMKPIATLRQALPSVDFATLEAVPATWQRSDTTSVPAASVVGEAVVALELANALLERFGGASMAAFERAVAGYRESLRAV